MKLFLDTADIDAIKRLAKTGLVDGITTNPSLVQQSGHNFIDAVKEICDIIEGPVSAEVVATETVAMVKEGHHLAKIAPNVLVKVPLTFAGLEACSILTEEGVPVNVTLCFSPTQALLAAKAGAMFVSPFIGRLDDIGEDGAQLLYDIVEIYSNYPDLDTEILAASIRHPMHVVEAAKAGCDAATIPPKIFEQIIKHPLTDKGLDAFLADWKKTGQKIV